MTQTDPLLQPFQLKHLRLKNRILSTSHEPSYAEDAKPKLRYQLYQEEKAKGGVALTMFGGSANIAPDSPAAFGQIYVGDDSIIPYFQQMAERIHRHGAAVMCQITHMGRRTYWDTENWLPTIAPSSVREPAHRSFPKEMEIADIKRVIKAYGAAARRCKEGGLDGVEIESYGHLFDSFWTPLVNRRVDEYGGSLDNRMRFSLEILAEIRKQVGDDFIVGIRMSGSEMLEGGLSPEESLEIAVRHAESGLIDFVNVVGADATTDLGISKLIPTMGQRTAPYTELARTIRAAIRLPVRASASSTRSGVVPRCSASRRARKAAIPRALRGSPAASTWRSHSVSNPIERLLRLAEPTRALLSSTTITLACTFRRTSSPGKRGWSRRKRPA